MSDRSDTHSSSTILMSQEPAARQPAERQPWEDEPADSEPEHGRRRRRRFHPHVPDAVRAAAVEVDAGLRELHGRREVRERPGVVSIAVAVADVVVDVLRRRAKVPLVHEVQEVGGVQVAPFPRRAAGLFLVAVVDAELEVGEDPVDEVVHRDGAPQRHVERAQHDPRDLVLEEQDVLDDPHHAPVRPGPVLQPFRVGSGQDRHHREQEAAVDEHHVGEFTVVVQAIEIVSVAVLRLHQQRADRAQQPPGAAIRRGRAVAELVHHGLLHRFHLDEVRPGAVVGADGDHVRHEVALLVLEAAPHAPRHLLDEKRPV